MNKLWIWRKVFLYLALSTLCSMLTGCAAQGPNYEHAPQEPGKAAIYVYRTYPTAGIAAAAKASVTCANNSVKLGPAGYHRFAVDPGDILCSSRTENTAHVQFTAKAGQDYYVRQSLTVGFVIAHVYLEQVDAEAAQADLQICKLQ